MAQPAVTIIVPVYNAAEYIERCLHSLFRQTISDIEYIFIDDCTPDNSFEILDSVLQIYPERKNQVRIIHHPRNLGVGRARRSGMEAATGEYSIHCDPDDWMEQNAIELLFTKAKETDTDIVVGRYIKHYEDKDVLSPSKTEMAKGLTLLKKFHISYALWEQIIRTTLIKDNNIYPWEGLDYGEDNSVLFQAFALAKKVTGIEAVTYHYDCTHGNSLSGIDFHRKKANIDLLLDNFAKWFSNNRLLTDDEIQLMINVYKEGKKAHLLSKEHRNLELWYATWPECNRHYISTLTGADRWAFSIGQFIPMITELYLKYIDWRMRNG